MGQYSGEIRFEGVNSWGQIIVSVFNAEATLSNGNLRDFSSDSNFNVVIDDEIPEVTLYDGETQNRYTFHLSNGSQWGLADEQYMGNGISQYL